MGVPLLGGDKKDQGLLTNWSIATGGESSHWALAGVTSQAAASGQRWGLVAISPGQCPYPAGRLKVAPTREDVGTGRVLFGMFFLLVFVPVAL